MRVAFLLSLCYYKQTLDVIGIDFLNESALAKVALTLSGHLGLNFFLIACPFTYLYSVLSLVLRTLI